MKSIVFNSDMDTITCREDLYPREERDVYNFINL